MALNTPVTVGQLVAKLQKLDSKEELSAVMRLALRGDIRFAPAVPTEPPFNGAKPEIVGGKIVGWSA